MFGYQRKDGMRTRRKFVETRGTGGPLRSTLLDQPIPYLLSKNKQTHRTHKIEETKIDATNQIYTNRRGNKRTCAKIQKKTDKVENEQMKGII